MSRSNRDFRDLYIASGVDEQADFIPLITDEDEESIENEKLPKLLPILPLRNTVLFPGVIIPISVGRTKSLNLVKDAYSSSNLIGTIAQKDPALDSPRTDELYSVGTVAQVVKILEMPDGTTSVIIQGKSKFKVTKYVSEKPYYSAEVEALADSRPNIKDKEYEALVGSLKDLSLRIINLSSNIPTEASFAVKNIESSTFLINFISSNSDVKLHEKQNLLEISDLKKRGTKLLEYLVKEVQMLELKNDIQAKVKVEVDQQQREYMLHQQMKTIQDELGGNPLDQELEELRQKGKKKKWPKQVAELFEKELEKSYRLNPATGEYSVQMNYLQVLLDLPWNHYTKDNFDLLKAQKVLDADHYGLDNVKDRILEHLAVLKLKGDLKAPILCLVGPPGVGKTSLGKSVARAIGRKYVRMSLGGLRDEAEIRGHRKTYIGAMPGRIIQNLKKVKSSNPVFILDELDKVGREAHGDPSSALLEVLDPEQNNSFYDNFLEIEYDLSKVMFIATANTLSTIHPALRDRMEVIDVNGYIIEEKIEIAKRHLIPDLLKENGVKKSQLTFSDEAIEYIVENYTRESGVRALDKQIAKMIRKYAKKIAFGEKFKRDLTIENINEILGHPRYIKEKYQGNDYAGLVTGLAWTAAGGEILYIETSLSKGKGKLTLTGNLGDVMKESAVIALEYIKSHSTTLGISENIFENWNIHVHVPEGAIPKDGPSAGITMATSIASALTQRKIRKNIAMTGEITLRGKVLPVGGIKEKILAAKRAGITEILLSQENKKDILEIKDIYLKGLKFHYVKDIIDVLEFALLKEKVKNPLKLDVEKEVEKA